jgi:hypothetical protein
MSRSRILHHVGIKDFKRVRQRQIGEQKERAAKELKEWQEVEEQKKKREEELKQFKSDWRSTLTESEWYAISGSGPTNGTTQTFAFGDPDSGIETRVSGIGGLEQLPSSVTIDGEVYDAPTYNQLAIQGYAPLMQMQRRTDLQDVNPYLDASQQFARAIGADYMMNARVQTIEDDLKKIAAQFDSSLIENMDENIKLAIEAIKNGQQPPLVSPPDPPYTGMSYEQMVDEQNKISDKYNDLIYPLNKELDKYAGQLAPAGLVAKINALVEEQNKKQNEVYEKYSKYNEEYGNLLAKRADEWSKFVNAIESYRKGFSFNPPSQEVAQVAGPPQLIPYQDAVINTLRYAFGLYDPNKPIKGGQTKELNVAILNTVTNALQRGAVPDSEGYYRVDAGQDYRGDVENIPAQALLNNYKFKINGNKLEVKDRFNFDDVLGTKIGGAFGGNPIAQFAASRLVDLGDRVSKNIYGIDPRNDARAGFELSYQIGIPKSHPLRKKKTQNESTTWERIQKYR